MNINPMQLMQMKGEIEKFDSRHPKLQMFLKDAMSRVDTGAVIEMSVTDATGNKVRTNFRVTQEDKALLHQISSMLGK
jgi:hypothetical protein